MLSREFATANKLAGVHGALSTRYLWTGPADRRQNCLHLASVCADTFHGKGVVSHAGRHRDSTVFGVQSNRASIAKALNYCCRLTCGVMDSDFLALVRLGERKKKTWREIGRKRESQRDKHTRRDTHTCNMFALIPASGYRTLRSWLLHQDSCLCRLNCRM